MTASCLGMPNSRVPFSLEKLYRDHWSSVVRRCRRILGDEQEAKDAAQEVFLRAMDKACEFRHEAQWSTWLYRVATNLCLNCLRDTSRRIDILREEDTVEFLRPRRGVEADPETAIEARFALERLEGVLDERTISMVLRHHVEELSQGEIAQEFHTSRVTVNKRLSMFKRVSERFIAHREAAELEVERRSNAA